MFRASDERCASGTSERVGGLEVGSTRTFTSMPRRHSLMTSTTRAHWIEGSELRTVGAGVDASKVDSRFCVRVRLFRVRFGVVRWCVASTSDQQGFRREHPRSGWNGDDISQDATDINRQHVRRVRTHSSSAPSDPDAWQPRPTRLTRGPARRTRPATAKK